MGEWGISRAGVKIAKARIYIEILFSLFHLKPVREAPQGLFSISGSSNVIRFAHNKQARAKKAKFCFVDKNDGSSSRYCFSLFAWQQQQQQAAESLTACTDVFTQ